MSFDETELPSDFDPYTQSFNITIPGDGPIELTLTDMHEWALMGIRNSTNHAAQFGACIMVFIMMVVLTRDEKRRSPIFYINCIGLFTNGVKDLLHCFYYMDSFWHPYAYVTLDRSRTTGAEYATTITSAVFPVIVYVCILASLNLQVKAMLTAATAQWQKILIISTSVFLALVTIGFRFTLVVVNCQHIMAGEQDWQYGWLVLSSNVLLATAIVYSSAIFCGKLFFAIRQRRTLGMQSFGPMQILFTMSLQTLLIPAFFSISQFFIDTTFISSLVLTFTVLCLPLSAMWAATVSGPPRDTTPRSNSFFKSWKTNMTDMSLRSPSSPHTGRQASFSTSIPARIAEVDRC